MFTSSLRNIRSVTENIISYKVQFVQFVQFVIYCIVLNYGKYIRQCNVYEDVSYILTVESIGTINLS